jgi:hypothetical protein
MTFEKAQEILKKEYGLLVTYVDARTGKMMTVVKAESELESVTGVSYPEAGISLLPEDVVKLARGQVTVSELAIRTNPAVELGRRGGRKMSKRGPDYFRKIAAMRKTFAGGRPSKGNGKRG